MKEEYPVALVTGSSRGLGRGVAEALARAGWSVAIHYASNAKAAEETAEVCGKLAMHPGQKFPVVGANLAKREEREALLPQVLHALGRIDALVNNAGIAPRVRADVTEASEESFDELISTNLKGPYFLTQAVARWMLEHQGESVAPSGYSIIFVTSISAETASVNRGDYCLSKAGLAMATQLWATRLAGEGVSVFEVRPGIMKTDMTAGVTEKYDKLIADGLVPQGRWGTGDDVGRAVLSLVRGDWPFSTGAVLPVDGGFHVRRL
jgi:NAD(P)-dependent dehydrogenase (short-subunit alcohol dehydrogenase family)